MTGSRKASALFWYLAFSSGILEISDRARAAAAQRSASARECDGTCANACAEIANATTSESLRIMFSPQIANLVVRYFVRYRREISQRLSYVAAPEIFETQVAWKIT